MEKAIELIVVASPFVLAALAGLVVALAAIAPRTKTKLDDQALSILQKAQAALVWLLAKLPVTSAAKAAVGKEMVKQAAKTEAAKK